MAVGACHLTWHDDLDASKQGVGGRRAFGNARVAELEHAPFGLLSTHQLRRAECLGSQLAPVPHVSNGLWAGLDYVVGASARRLGCRLPQGAHTQLLQVCRKALEILG